MYIRYCKHKDHLDNKQKRQSATKVKSENEKGRMDPPLSKQSSNLF